MHAHFQRYLELLEARHLADLRFSDVTRALRALSSAYVERRETALAANKALDGAGKRAAFALYYGPLHFLLVDHIISELGVELNAGTVVDVGCGTGVAGASVASSNTPQLSVLGIDTHPWAVTEARFTYQSFELRADVRRGAAAKTHFPKDTSAIVAAFVVNELNDADRRALLNQIAATKVTALIVEPISQRISPWWDDWAAEFTALGGRADTWKARIEPPLIVKRLARSSGLRPELLTARSLFVSR